MSGVIPLGDMNVDTGIKKRFFRAEYLTAVRLERTECANAQPQPPASRRTEQSGEPDTIG